MKLLLSLSLLFALSSCGVKIGSPDAPNGRSARDATFGSQAVRLVSAPGALTADNGVLQGTGTSIFRQPLASRSSASGYEIYFQLQDGASLTLISHADESMEGGFEIEFHRQGSGRGSLQVALRANGTSRGTASPRGGEVFQNLDASGPLWLEVDVHNEMLNGARALIWNLAQTGSDFSPTAALLDTADPLWKSDGTPGNGSGNRWGLYLQGATVNRAIAGGAK